MFTAALLTIARTWKQSRCPLTGEWIKKLWYIYTMECYSAIKLNTSELILKRWMDLEPIIQSEVHQKEKKQISYINIYRENLERWYWWTYSQSSSEDADREQIYGQGWGKGGRGWDEWREQHGSIYTNIRNQTAKGNLPYDSGHSNWGSTIT